MKRRKWKERNCNTYNHNYILYSYRSFLNTPHIQDSEFSTITIDIMNKRYKNKIHVEPRKLMGVQTTITLTDPVSLPRTLNNHNVLTCFLWSPLKTTADTVTLQHLQSQCYNHNVITIIIKIKKKTKKLAVEQLTLTIPVRLPHLTISRQWHLYNNHNVLLRFVLFCLCVQQL